VRASLEPSPRAPWLTFPSLAVTLVHKHFPHRDISLPSGLISALSTVLGLVISFRTSSAYERYSEGRKQWSTIQLSARNLAHMIWNHIPNDRDALHKPAPAGATDDAAQRRVVEALVEKKTMINLLHAFAVAVKHMLRDEPSIYYEVRLARAVCQSSR
jgi:putative membrane protein